MQNRITKQKTGKLSKEQTKFLTKLSFLAENGTRMGQKHLGNVAKVLLVYLPTSPVLAIILSYMMGVEEKIIDKIRELFNFQMEI